MDNYFETGLLEHLKCAYTLLAGIKLPWKVEN